MEGTEESGPWLAIKHVFPFHSLYIDPFLSPFTFWILQTWQFPLLYAFPGHTKLTTVPKSIGPNDQGLKFAELWLQVNVSP